MWLWVVFGNSHHVPPHIFIFSLETFDTATWDKVTRYLTLQSLTRVSNTILNSQLSSLRRTRIWIHRSKLKFTFRGPPSNLPIVSRKDKPTKQITHGQEPKARCVGHRRMHHRGTPWNLLGGPASDEELVQIDPSGQSQWAATFFTIRALTHISALYLARTMRS